MKNIKHKRGKVSIPQKNSEFEFAQAVLDFEKKNFSSTSDLKEG